MEIRYLDDVRFVLSGEQRISINPERRSDGEIALYSKRKSLRGLIVDGPGEYEIGGILVLTLPIGEKLAHAIEVSGVNVVYLETVPAELTPAQIEALGRVDVLIVNTHDLRATQAAVAALTPRVVVPFGAGAVEACKMLGQAQPRSQVKWAWNGSASMPKAVLLKAPSGRNRNAA